LGVGRKADDLALQKNYCSEIQRNEKTRSNLAVYSKEDRGSKRAVLPVVVVVMMMMMMISSETSSSIFK
jgi:hypothetical protein